MTGSLIALFSGLSFAGSNVFLRRGVYRSGESFSPMPVSVFLGVAFFGVLILVSGQAAQLRLLSWSGASSLAGAGVIHFVLGRVTAYTSFRLIGSNRASPIHTCNILVAALSGIVFFGEPLTISLVLALLLIVGGITLIGTMGNSGTGKISVPKGSLIKGLFFALAAAIFWGFSPMLIKIGLREINSPLAATFVSYVAASIVAGGLLLSAENKKKLRRLNSASLIPITAGAILLSIGQALRYTAFSYGHISVMSPLVTGTNGILTLPLSFLLNREIESFNLKIILATVAVMAGVLLLFLAA